MTKLYFSSLTQQYFWLPFHHSSNGRRPTFDCKDFNLILMANNQVWSTIKSSFQLWSIVLPITLHGVKKIAQWNIRYYECFSAVRQPATTLIALRTVIEFLQYIFYTLSSSRLFVVYYAPLWWSLPCSLHDTKSLITIHLLYFTCKIHLSMFGSLQFYKLLDNWSRWYFLPEMLTLYLI